MRVSVERSITRMNRATLNFLAGLSLALLPVLAGLAPTFGNVTGFRILGVLGPFPHWIKPLYDAVVMTTFCLLCLAPCAWVVTWFFPRGRNSRTESGRCRRCGYDLRATPGRCLECGLMVA